MHKTFFSLLLSAVLAITANVTGSWTGTVDVGNGGGNPTIPMSLILKQDGNELTGTAGDESHRFSIEKAKIDGDSIKFNLTLGPTALSFDLHQQGDLLKGTAKIQHPDGVIHEGPASFTRK
jgi:hypothetical protein